MGILKGGLLTSLWTQEVEPHGKSLTNRIYTLQAELWAIL